MEHQFYSDEEYDTHWENPVPTGSGAGDVTLKEEREAFFGFDNGIDDENPVEQFDNKALDQQLGTTRSTAYLINVRGQQDDDEPPNQFAYAQQQVIPHPHFRMTDKMPPYFDGSRIFEYREAIREWLLHTTLAEDLSLIHI